MGLTERLNRAALSFLRPARSGAYPYSTTDYLQWVSTQGGMFPMYGMGKGTLAQTNEEPPDGSFESLVRGAYHQNGVVFATEVSRLMLFKSARFVYQAMADGIPGDVVGGPDRAILDTPWPGGTTGDLLGRMLLDADLGGTAIVARRRDDRSRLALLRPDWTIIVGADADGQEVLGVAYFDGGIVALKQPEVLMRDEVAVFTLVPDPLARFRGLPWLTPIVNEVMGDKAITQHKLDFFRNGATVNQVVTFDPGVTLDHFDAWVDKFGKAHDNQRGKAFKTLFLAGGVKYDRVGATPQEIDLKAIQGAGETRIAAAGNVPPIIVGLSEGLASATYSNYGQARRRFADLMARPAWQSAADALAPIISVPSGARLWYYDRDIPFLQEDVEDNARIAQMETYAIRTLIDAGFLPESVVAAVTASDWRLLDHSGLFSVQLQKPQPDAAQAAADPARMLAAMLAPYLSQPAQAPALPEKAGRAGEVERARQALIEAGIPRPTNEQVAEHMGIAVRTLYDWKREAA